MDVLYEECAVNQNSARGEKLYKIFNIAYYVCLIIAIISGLSALMNVPFGTPDSSAEGQQAYAVAQSFFIMSLFFFVPMTTGAIGFYFLKKRVNINYDYTFVSGELRIVKVFNVNKRKVVTKIQADDILQLGDYESESFNRLATDPMNKQVVCTQNDTPMAGKFFLYIHVSEPIGKRLYILECREEMLVNILHFVKRGTLASDYVMQEKKQK